MRKGIIILAVAGIAPALWGGIFGGGLDHKNIITPKTVAEMKGEALGIGAISSILSTNGKLVVAGHSGLALVDGAGKVVWTLALPEMKQRFVTADGQGIAWTASNQTATEKAGTLATLAGMQTMTEVLYDEAWAGLVSLDGKEVWKVNLKAKSQVSRPLLTPDRVAVSTGGAMPVLDRATGATVGVADDGMVDIKMTQGWTSQQPRHSPAYLDGHYFNLFFMTMMVADKDGKKLKMTNNLGITPLHEFLSLMTHPVIFKGMVVFGGAPQTYGLEAQGKGGGAFKLANTNHKGHVYAVDAEGKEKWTSHVGNADTGTGSLATNGELVFAATNTHVAAFDEGGKEIWSKDGTAVEQGSNRGVRYSRNGEKLYALRPKSQNLLLASAKQVFLTSHIVKEHSITVLDAAKGDYVATWKVPNIVTDLALVNNQLVVADKEGLKFYVTE